MRGSRAAPGAAAYRITIDRVDCRANLPLRPSINRFSLLQLTRKKERRKETTQLKATLLKLLLLLSKCACFGLLTCCQNWARRSGPCDLVVNQSKDSISLQQTSQHDRRLNVQHFQRCVQNLIKTPFFSLFGAIFKFQIEIFNNNNNNVDLK